jgi:hypothetical protein
MRMGDFPRVDLGGGVEDGGVALHGQAVARGLAVVGADQLERDAAQQTFARHGLHGESGHHYS